MDEFESLSHSKWECKYNVVFIPKCRRKVLYGELRKHLGCSASLRNTERAASKGASAVGSRSHDAVDSTQVRGQPSRGVHQEQSAIHLA